MLSKTPSSGPFFHHEANRLIQKSDTQRNAYILDPTYNRIMCSLFNKTRAGHGSELLYVSSNYVLWEKQPNPPNYYVSTAGEQMLVDHEGYYKKLGESLKQEGMPLVVFELGVGSAAKTKTIPFIKAVGADVYCAADSSFEAAFGTLEEVITALPDIQRRLVLTTDFNKASMQMPQGGHCIMLQLGSPLSNMEGCLDDEMPEKAVTSALENYRRHLTKGDYLIIELDMNQDEESLHLCYSDPIHESLAMGLLARAQNELPLKGFEITNFAHKRVWNPQNHLYAHCFEVQRTHTLQVAGEVVDLNRGELLQYANSYKFPQYFMDRIYPQTHFRLVDVIPDRNKRLHHQVLEAI